MLRQAIFYLLLSILTIIFASYVKIILIYINNFYNYINKILIPTLNQAGFGQLTSQMLILVFIPPLIATVPALIFRVLTGKNMAYFIELTWCLWLIILLSHLLVR